MGWGEKHKSANGGAGTTQEIEDAHILLDKHGVPRGPLALRVIEFFESQR